MWDERYAVEHYVYGTEPNGFLVAMADRIPAGRVLCLGEGEGRNAVWLAEQGFAVTAVDASGVGLAKARRLAQRRGTQIQTIQADLTHFAIKPGAWDAVVYIFCHLPPALRLSVHRRAVGGLRPGGMFLLEAYTPRQLRYETGGPPTADMMMDLGTLGRELAGLEFLHAEELVREIHEGEFHDGPGAVVQVLGRRPEQ